MTALASGARSDVFYNEPNENVFLVPHRGTEYRPLALEMTYPNVSRKLPAEWQFECSAILPAIRPGLGRASHPHWYLPEFEVPCSMDAEPFISLESSLGMLFGEEAVEEEFEASAEVLSNTEIGAIPVYQNKARRQARPTVTGTEAMTSDNSSELVCLLSSCFVWVARFNLPLGAERVLLQI